MSEEPGPPPPPPPAQPQRIPPCPDCGGTRVGDLLVGAQGANFTGVIPRGQPSFLGFRSVARLVAYVCLQCGNVKLYMDDLAWLQDAARQHPEWFRW